MICYKHKVQYYETDKMGITHHSNYVRFMEEARIYFLERIGFSYDKMEQMGVISPVISINCEYKEPTTFNDELEIEVGIVEYNGIRIKFGYTMRKSGSDKAVLRATSEHCFVDDTGKLLIIKRAYPEIHSTLGGLLEGKTE